MSAFSLQTVCFLLSGRPCSFLLKAWHVVLGTGTEVKWSLVSGFMLFWPGARPITEGAGALMGIDFFS